MPTANPSQPVSRVEAAVLQARGFMEKRQFQKALTAAESLLVEVPENRDVLYIVAVNQRYLGRIQDALATLERFAREHPDFGRLYQERGHCYRALGDTPAAIAAYRHAIALNAALPASWKALAGLYRLTGQAQDAQAAAQVAAHLAAMPVAVATATSLFAEGETFAAERMIRQ